VAVPGGRRSRYELADRRLAHALADLVELALAIDPDTACPVDTDDEHAVTGPAHHHGRSCGGAPVGLRRRIRLLVAATIGYNVIEAVVAIGTGADRLLHGADRFRAGLGGQGCCSRC